MPNVDCRYFIVKAWNKIHRRKWRANEYTKKLEQYMKSMHVNVYMLWIEMTHNAERTTPYKYRYICCWILNINWFFSQKMTNNGNDFASNAKILFIVSSSLDASFLFINIETNFLLVQCPVPIHGLPTTFFDYTMCGFAEKKYRQKNQ